MLLAAFFVARAGLGHAQSTHAGKGDLVFAAADQGQQILTARDAPVQALESLEPIGEGLIDVDNVPVHKCQI